MSKLNMSKGQKKIALVATAVVVAGLVIYGISSFAGSSNSRAKVVRQAKSRIGKAAIGYGRNGAGGWGPNKFHSPGLVWWSHVTAGNSYMKRVGKGNVAHYARYGRKTTRVRPGDLMFFKQPGSRSRRPVMVAVYNSNLERDFVYASATCRKVVLRAYNSRYPCSDTGQTFRRNYLFTKDYILNISRSVNSNVEEEEGVDEAELLKEN